MSAPELKPCPICKARPDIINQYTSVVKDGGWWVAACQNFSCPDGPSTRHEPTKESAIIAWNAMGENL